MKTAICLFVATFGLATFNVAAATLYVSLESTNPMAPYATWATAATNIQDAVDASKDGDTVLVTNGVYAVGGRETFDSNTNSIGISRVAITNSITLEGVNGPIVTIIDGGGSLRCFYLGTIGVLSGFTLTNGYATLEGGGVYCTSTNALLTNCVISGNTAGVGSWGGGAYGCTLFDCVLRGNSASSEGGGACYCTLFNCTLTGNQSAYEGGGASLSTIFNCTVAGNSAIDGGGAFGSTLFNCRLSGNSSRYGGGASGCTLNNCTLTGNSADDYGGGADVSTLYNCVLTDNSASNDGGGASCSTLFNCTVSGNSGGGVGGKPKACYCIVYNSIVYYNSGGNYSGASFNHCCTSPLPTNNEGNITGPPLFMDMAAGDFRLREGSPCIDAGADLAVLNVGYANAPTDILGNTRFIDGNGDGILAWDIGAYEFNSFKPPRFASTPQLTTNGWTLNITGPTNKWVSVQRSSDLKNWVEIWSRWMESEGIQQINDGDTSQTMMFYRVVIQ